ncbi:site-specific integrase [Saccharopolyspora karakumensis]|uniref:Site-specific integrase n=2 Tax=Saccharopolyspora karakumensis TaxID=2530386 RepID=A0A4R5BTA2_9PSEU|nr:site-specific integrase [Saccharopolyspora karakumensis]
MSPNTTSKCRDEVSAASLHPHGRASVLTPSTWRSPHQLVSKGATADVSGRCRHPSLPPLTRADSPCGGRWGEDRAATTEPQPMRLSPSPPALGNIRLFEIRPPVINALCQSVLKANSLSLARHVRAVIGNVMTYAVQAGAVDRNPVREIAPLTERKAKTKRRKARALTAEELLDLLAKLDADEEALRWDLPGLVRLFVATGERRGEALGAHWSDFDPENQVLTMTGNIISARGRGTIRNKGKSEAADREIPLPDWCVRMLQERYAAIGDVDPDKPIFTNTQGGYLNASNLTNRVWVPFRKRAGFEWVTFHTFRKTVATLLDDAGLTARQVADVLGHSHPSMTLNNYMGRGQVSRAGAEALSLVVKTADPKIGDKLANRLPDDASGDDESEA